MKILLVSDRVEPVFTGDRIPESFRGMDAIISCGDLPPEYLADLRNRLDAPLYYVRGNHDLRYDDSPPMGCVDLDERMETMNGFRMVGFAGSRWYNGNPNQYTEAGMRWKVWRMRPRIWLRRGVDMVVTHAPPRFINDAEDLCHRGFRSFLDLIRWHQPAYFCHGHIHRLFTNPEERITRIGATHVINCFGHFILDTDHEHEEIPVRQMEIR